MKYKGIKFGKLRSHKPKKGRFMPFGGFKSRKILSGKNKGKSALWF